MKRNVILMGGKTHVISLPIKWIKKYNIKKGEELEIQEKNNKLTITTEKVPKKPPLKINLEKANSSIIIRNIINSYQLGYSELDLIFSKKTIHNKTQKETKTLNLIQDTCDQLIGFEIIEQKDTYCKIKDVAGNSINEFKNILRRIFLMINSLGKETLENINDYEELKDLHRKYITIRKYIHYCQRYLNIKGFENKTTQFNEIIIRLLDISRTYRIIQKTQIQSKYKYSKETLKLLKDTIILQEEFYKLFYKFSLEKATELTKTRVEIFQEINKTREKQENLILLHRLPSILNTILSLTNTTIAINFKE